MTSCAALSPALVSTVRGVASRRLRCAASRCSLAASACALVSESAAGSATAAAAASGQQPRHGARSECAGTRPCAVLHAADAQCLLGHAPRALFLGSLRRSRWQRKQRGWLAGPTSSERCTARGAAAAGSSPLAASAMAQGAHSRTGCGRRTAQAHARRRQPHAAPPHVSSAEVRAPRCCMHTPVPMPLTAQMRECSGWRWGTSLAVRRPAEGSGWDSAGQLATLHSTRAVSRTATWHHARPLRPAAVVHSAKRSDGVLSLLHAAPLSAAAAGESGFNPDSLRTQNIDDPPCTAPV